MHFTGGNHFTVDPRRYPCTIYHIESEQFLLQAFPGPKTHASLLRLIHWGNWFTSIDLKYAYFHIPIYTTQNVSGSPWGLIRVPQSSAFEPIQGAKICTKLDLQSAETWKTFFNIGIWPTDTKSAGSVKSVKLQADMSASSSCCLHNTYLHRRCHFV